MRHNLFRILLFILFTVLVSGSLHAQVTIGTDNPPEKAALLDIKTQNGGASGGITSDKGGFVLPRVELDNISELTVFPGITQSDADYAEQKLRHKGMMIYNITADLSKNIEEGIYVWTGAKWEKAALKQRINFFYMPSIIVPTTTTGTKTIDLYQNYVQQFASPKVASLGAPAQIPFFVNREDLYYYVTEYDTDVFDESGPFSIDAEGILTYTVKNPPTDGTSYINIVFVVKY